MKDFQIDKYRIDLMQYSGTFQIGDVDGMYNGISSAIGFVLFVKDGYLQMLEGYTNAIDAWPQNEKDIILSYDSGEIRDFDQLQQKWRLDR